MRVVAGPAGRMLLLLLAGAAVLAILALPGLRFDHDTHSLLRADAEADAREAELVKAFGSEDILLVAWEVDDALRPAAFRRLRAVTKELAQVAGLEEIYSLASPIVKLPLDGGLRPLRESDLADDASRARVRKALLEAPVYLGTLYNATLDVVATAGTLAPGSREARRRTLLRIREVAARHDRPGSHLHVAGVTALAVEAGEYAVRDLKRIGLLALAVSVVLLLVVCRSWTEAVVAALATGLPPLYALGTAAALDLPVTALGAALFPVLAVVGITGSVHLLYAYAAGRNEGLEAGAAAATAARRLAAPIGLSLLTTALAFVSLRATGVPAFRTGGLIVALGLVLAGPVVLLGLPAALARLAPRPSRPRRTLAPLLVRGLRAVLARPRGTVLAGLLLLGGGAWLTTRARLRIEVLQAFRPESGIARSYRFLDERLTATVTVDLVLRARPGADTSEVLDDLRRFAKRALRLEGVRSVMSLASLVDYGQRLSGLAEGPALVVLRTAFPEITRRFHHPATHRFRAKIRVREGTPPEVLDGLRAAAADLGSGRGSLTGLFVRAVGTARSLVRDLTRGVLAMSLAVGLLLVAALRSWRLGLAALPPNLLPPAVVFGVAELVGIPFDVSVVAVGAVAVGLAVDDTFHVLFRFAHERLAGGTVEQALERTQRAVGRALVTSSVVLVAGLACLAFSSFLPTARFGLFSAAACAVALPADLLLLPAILKLARLPAIES